MPNEVIDRVHRMAHQEHGNNGLLFEDRNHHPLVDPDDDRDDDSTYHPEEDDNSDDDEEDDNSDGQDGYDDDDPGPPDDPHEGPPDHNNLPQTAEDHVAPIDPNNEDPEPDNVAEDIGTLPPHVQDDEHPTDNEEEQMPNNQDGDPINNDIGTPTVPNDPTLPPRVRRELNRLANDGVGPTIYHGRTRSQTRQQQHNLTTTGHLETSTPFPYQHMTDFEKELFHR